MASRAAQLAIEMQEKGADQVAGGLDDVTASAKKMGDTVDRASKQAEDGASRLDKTTESADELASKGSQAAGALGGLGSLIGGPFGAAMETGGVAMQAAADSGDLLNAALENSVVASARAKAGTIAKTVADKASAVATKAMTVAQKALNLAQRASPIGLIITGVLLLVGGLILAYRHSARFRAIVDAAMRVAKAGVDKAVSAFKSLGPVVSAVMRIVARVVGTYVKVYVAAFQLGFRLAKATFEGIKDAVSNAVGFITDKASDLKGRLSDAWNSVRRTGVSAFKALIAPVQRIIDLVQNLIDKISNIHIPHPDLNPFNKSGFNPTQLLRAGGGSLVAAGDTITIPVTITGGASASDGEAFMRAIDSRLKSLGKKAVFSK